MTPADRPTVDLLAPAFTADPYSAYRRLRELRPVAWTTTTVPGYRGFWLVTRHADAVAVLSDPRFGRELQKGAPPPNVSQSPLLDLIGKWMVVRDPPDHTRLRALVNKVFTPGLADSLAARTRAAAEVLLDDAGQSFDLIRDFAFPLPMLVIAELLGIPTADRDQFREWSSGMVEGVDLRRNPGGTERGDAAATSLTAYFRKVVEERRTNRGHDVLSGLIAAEESGDRLSTDELVAMCILLMFAGHETTTNLIGNGVFTLLRNPEQLARLRSDPTLVKSAVEECLRYESPQQLVFRYALADAVIAGQAVRKGQLVAVSLGAANRDPAVFPEPDSFDVARAPNPHLAFGRGIHYCVGAPLSRMEAQAAFTVLLERAPGLRLVAEPAWSGRVMLRGLAGLRVEV
jgi:cytochrome P450